MTDQNDCQFESRILEAVRSNVWTDELRAHAAGCSACSELARVSDALLVMAHSTPIPTSLPNFRLIWLKAQVLQSQQRAARLELLGRLGIVAAVFVSLAVTAVWYWLGSTPGEASAQSLIDWRHTLKMAAPLIVALVLVFGANSVKPLFKRDQWL
jgi:hypothetical protein